MRGSWDATGVGKGTRTSSNRASNVSFRVLRTRCIGFILSECWSGSMLRMLSPDSRLLGVECWCRAICTTRSGVHAMPTWPLKITLGTVSEAFSKTRHTWRIYMVYILILEAGALVSTARNILTRCFCFLHRSQALLTRVGSLSERSIP